MVGTAALAVAGALAVPAVAGATTEPPVGVGIGPNQAFTAAVNGGDGSVSPVVVRVNCPGPVPVGAWYGTAAAGQTVSVALAGASASRLGNTGSAADAVVASFRGGFPTPVSAPPTAVTFKEYGTQKVPTTLQLPCSGPGTVTFVPEPSSPTAVAIVVPVRYVGGCWSTDRSCAD